MWILSKIPQNISASEHESLMDLSLSLSPHSACLDGRYLLVSLHSLTRYWNLSQLPAALEPHEGVKNLNVGVSRQSHPLLDKLRHFARRYQLNFVAAHTAPAALWAVEHLAPKHPLLSHYTQQEWVEAISPHTLKSSTTLLEDFLLRKPHLKAELAYFIELGRDLGIRNFSDLAPFLSNHAQREGLVTRFGPAIEKLLRRLSGADDVELTWYEPRPYFEDRFSPQLESFMSSELSEKLTSLQRIQQIFCDWGDRLSARRSVLSGFQVTVTVSRRQTEHALIINFARPTRESQSFYDLFLEKWLALCSDTQNTASLLEDEITEVHLKSLKLEHDHDRQLNLFDPHREELDEKWNVLVGQLRVKANNNVQIGGYRAFESFYPENSIEWVEWEEWSRLPPPPVMDHPRRPVLLLNKPCEISETSHIKNEEDFMTFIASKNALMSLEKLRDPWRSGKLKASAVHFEEDVCERSYSRVDGQWLFWDHSQKKVFLHGHFE